ncbi:DUF815 domain-containing protein [Thermaurantiacus sp.]
METGPEPLLTRIARALERLAPEEVQEADPAVATAMRWDGRHLLSVAPAATLPLSRFVAVEAQMMQLSRNLQSLARGGPAHDMLLWGARGMGKSALVRSLAEGHGIALVETAAMGLESLPRLFPRLAQAPGPFLIFVDDLAFESGDPALRQLRSLLDGGVARRPDHCRLAVTSNHRHLIADSPPSDTRSLRDSRDDALALVDRFGMVLGFHPASQEEYLAMCRTYLAAEGLPLDEAEALAFALARGGRSGRTAFHYLVECLTRRAQPPA